MPFGLELAGTDLAWVPLLVQDMTPTYFESLKTYVGFDDQSSAALAELHPLAEPHFESIVDDFYATIDAHPGARVVITGGHAQIGRLKQTLLQWLDQMLLGPHDESYYQLRARIGRVHVRIALPQQFMLTAIDRIRVQLSEVIAGQVSDRTTLTRLTKALHQIIDLDLAVMLETYREDLVAANRSAERLATIGQFAASMGHELRNPLAVVESSAYLAKQHLGAEQGSPHVAKHLDRITAEVERANKTISNLLDLARNKPPRRQPADLGLLVESAAEASLLPAAVTFESRVPSGLWGNVDADQLRQVLVNLINNACQALGGRGHVWIDGDTTPDGTARLRVQDDGPGVREEDQLRIFEALFTTKAKGSGLGLALCRHIIENHGGTIELDATARGASFLMTIPPR